MMKKLIVSATGKEITPLLKQAIQQSGGLYALTENTGILITGVGIVQTIYHLTHTLENGNYQQLINVGVAGSFSPDFSVGTVVEVCSDTFGDWGIDDNENFIPLWETGLFDKNTFPFENGWLNNPVTFDKQLPQTKGITVQTTGGNTLQIAKREQLFSPDIETMESAAFFFVALRKQIPFAAIRAISNKVEPRNKQNWDIDLAISNLNRYLKNKI